jgi:plastocyanin
MRAGLKSAMCPAVGAALVLAMPGVAHAAQKSVDMGTPRASQQTFQRVQSDVNNFFPRRVTIRVGDTVRFRPMAFHTVNLPRRGGGRVRDITPTGQKVSGAVDAAGAAFWFNGQDALAFNPMLLRPLFGQRRSYTGERAVLSGLPLTRNPRPMAVRFPKAGTYRYFCDLHLGMTGIVRVVRRNRPIPSARADRAAVRAQVQRTLRVARTLATGESPPANTVDVGRDGRGNVTYFGFVPSNLTVPSGTTVTFRMPARSEIHTATSGPGDPEKEPNSYLGQIVASLQSPTFDPRAVYPSEPPGTIGNLSPTFHGNGFWSSGVLDLNPRTPLPPSSAVRFVAPGVYQVICTIHPFMRGTVTVQ